MSSHQPATAIVLLSGGLDSATTLAIAREAGYRCVALSFRYGQRHGSELDAAGRVATSMGVADHRFIDIDLRSIGGSALTDDAIDVPRDEPDHASAAASIPVTYVPARNTIFLSYAAAHAEVEGAHDIFIGVNAVDYSGYPDCRAEFIAAFERAVNLGTRAGVEGRPLTIHTPLIQLSKAQIIRRGLELGVDYALTTSCYDPEPETRRACGSCESCRLRKRGFEEAGVPDPTRYARPARTVS